VYGGDRLEQRRGYEGFRVITLSAMCGAVFFLLPFWVPAFLGLISLLSLFSPLPLMYATRRLGLARGSLTVLLATLMLVLLKGPLIGLLFLFDFGILALSLCFLLEAHVSIERAILFSGLSTLLVTGAVGGVYATYADIGVLEGLRQWIDSALSQAIGALEKSNLPPEQVLVLQGRQEMLVQLFLSLTPSLVLGFMSMISFLNVITVNRVLSLLKQPPMFSVGDLTRWRSPDRLVWGLLAAGFCTAFYSGGFSVIAWNLLILFAVAYFFQGLSIVAYFFKTWRVPRFLAILIYFLMVTQFPLAVLIAITGLFDLWINFRRL